MKFKVGDYVVARFNRNAYYGKIKNIEFENEDKYTFPNIAVIISNVEPIIKVNRLQYIGETLHFFENELELDFKGLVQRAVERNEI